MDLLKILIVILHILILTNSYELICKVTKKERYLFIFWVFILQIMDLEWKKFHLPVLSLLI